MVAKAILKWPYPTQLLGLVDLQSYRYKKEESAQEPVCQHDQNNHSTQARGIDSGPGEGRVLLNLVAKGPSWKEKMQGPVKTHRRPQH